MSSHFQETISKFLGYYEVGISHLHTICMADFMKTKQIHLEEAFNDIKQRRSVLSPNFGFLGQFLQPESEIMTSTPTQRLCPAKWRQPALHSSPTCRH